MIEILGYLVHGRYLLRLMLTRGCSSWRYTLYRSCLYRWAVPVSLAGICVYNSIGICVFHIIQLKALCRLSPPFPLFTHSFSLYPFVLGWSSVLHPLRSEDHGTEGKEPSLHRRPGSAGLATWQGAPITTYWVLRTPH